jgi:undecaprenyl-diphosphatase
MPKHDDRKTVWSQVLDYDAQLLEMFQRVHVPPLTRALRAVTHVGDTAGWTFIGLVLIGVGRADLGLRLGAAALLATALSQVLKRGLRRSRPNTRPGITALVENPDAFSFPSGHTAGAFSIAIALANTGSALAPLLFTVACLIAISRVYLGAHYPLDVAAGGVLGIASGLAVVLAVA